MPGRRYCRRETMKRLAAVPALCMAKSKMLGKLAIRHAGSRRLWLCDQPPKLRIMVVAGGEGRGEGWQHSRAPSGTTRPGYLQLADAAVQLMSDDRVHISAEWALNELARQGLIEALNAR